MRRGRCCYPWSRTATIPLGVLDLVTRTVPGSADAPGMYKTFQEKADGCIKVVIKP